MVYRPNGDGPFSKKTEIEEKKSTKEMVEAAVTVAGAVLAVAGVVAWGVSSLFSSESSKNRKVMKPPGRNGKIFRDDFESDPKGYFKGLRKP